MITFQRELLCEVVQEVQPLLDLHYEELTLNKDRVRLAPQWPMYAALERADAFVVFTARDDGRLVGYNAFFLNRHMHYEGLMVAQNDVLFLHPDYRKGLTGVRILKFAEQCLRLAGAMKVCYHVKFSLDFRPILHRLNYADEEVMVGKLLQGD